MQTLTILPLRQFAEKYAPLADWGGSELIIRLQTGSIPVGRTSIANG